MLPGFFTRLAHALDCAEESCSHDSKVADGPTLSLARYMPSRFLSSGGEIEAFQIQLAGLLRSGLLKRFESSAHAFALTCERMAESHEAFSPLLGEGLVATGDALADWASTDSDDLDVAELARREGVDRAEAYDQEGLRNAVQADRDLLLAFAAEARAVGGGSRPKAKPPAERAGGDR